MNGLAMLMAKRICLGLITLFAVSVIIFAALELMPGDLAEQVLGQSATPETVAQFRKELGLDKAPHIRYFDWLGGALQGDFGVSLANKRSVADQLAPRLSLIHI